MTQFLNQKHAVVLGSSGFIGSKIAENLLATGHKVTGVDLRTNVLLSKNGNFVEKNINFLYEENWSDVFNACDTIYHCICTSTSSTSNLFVSKDANENLISTLRMLEALKSFKGKFVFLSSGGTIYGNPDLSPTPENYVGNQLSSYAIIKIAIEKYLYLFNQLYGLDYIILRLSNPYGPSQISKNGFGLIPTIINKILESSPIQIFGDGNQVRDYIFMDDLIELISIISKKPFLKQRTLNLGSGTGTSVLQLIHIIEKFLSLKATIKFCEKRKSDVESIILDISALKYEIGNYSFTPIEHGTQQIIKFKNQNFL